MKTLSIGKKLVSVVLGAVVLGIAIMATVVYTRTGSMQSDSAIEYTHALAEVHAKDVQAKLEAGLGVAQVMAQIMEGFGTIGLGGRRNYFNNMLQKVLESNPSFIGIWSCWEPKALDGLDSRYANREGSDETGRFIPYWNRSSGEIKLEPLVDYDKPGIGDYYQVPLKTGEDTIVEPYMYPLNGKDTLLISLVSPIKKDGKVLGVVGVDIVVDELQRMVEGIKPYGTGVSAIFSNNGTVVAHFDPSRIGKQMRDSERDMNGDRTDDFADAVKAGREHSHTVYADHMNTDIYVMATPISIGGTDTPWSFVVGVPINKVMEPVRSLLYYIAFVALAVTILVALVVLMAARGVTRPLQTVIGLAQRARGGDLTVAREDFGPTRGDELGQMADAIADMISKQRESLQAISSVAERLGNTAEDLSAVAQETNAGVEETRAGADDVSSQMDSLAITAKEMNVSVDEVASGAQSTAQKGTDMANEVDEARSAGEEGIDAVGKVASSVKGMAKEALRAAKEMKGLGDQAREIQSFVVQISRIADQTNLLALNAAIEAARAGEAGRGFAVVAEEVRNLAEESNQAATKIANLASEITKNLDIVVSSSEKNAKESQESSDLAENTKVIIDKMMDGLSKIASATQDLAAVSQEQAASSEEIASAVQGVSSKVSLAASSSDTVRSQIGEVASAAERVARGSEELAEVSMELRGLVRSFKLSESGRSQGLVSREN
ncbi:methyl-accepting chemotaxis protein [Dethiosulfovibrio salsuginis]|uniref:Methyl-accepting chemotaxis sensory transducer with Cache sensor n=1 Tax=Dethiosulfovibrio salsuginis TaxID=561720 RepID=A0A1X7ISW9_9BACT|nr:methyl-accepting chemotaxis protein [Dethiosulfovibrio salsuginis]SMG18267.1 methyl-accepting chemotaxis sensory transducer with Cache sensor [Dethiosulfovibrio salsuginis]